MLLRGDAPSQDAPFPGQLQMLQSSHLTDREILRRTITCISALVRTVSVVPARVSNGWKKKIDDPAQAGKKKEIWIKQEEWEAVMAHAEVQGLGILKNKGTTASIFEFAVDVPVDVATPTYLDWHNKLMQLCATSAEEYANHRLLKPHEEPPQPEEAVVEAADVSIEGMLAAAVNDGGANEATAAAANASQEPGADEATAAVANVSQEPGAKRPRGS